MTTLHPKPLRVAYESRLQSLADRIVRQDADYCTIRRITDGCVTRVVVASRDPGRIGLLREAVCRIRDLPAGHPSETVARTMAPLVCPDVDLHTIGVKSIDSQHYAALRALQVRSQLTLPVVLDGQCVGTLTMLACTRRYSDDDLRIAMRYANGAALLFAQKWTGKRTNERTNERTNAISVP